MNTLGLCSWIVDRSEPIRAMTMIGGDLNLRCAQVGFFSRATLDACDPTALKSTADHANVSIVGTFVGFDGEDYSSIERIAETGGLVPDDAYAARLQMLRDAAVFTATIDAPFIAIHAATIPNNSTSPLYNKLIERTREAADIVRHTGLRLLLETGREPVETLTRFIDDTGAGNIAVSFDPANLIIYGTDDPVRAVGKLKGRIECVHLKDAQRSADPGSTFGPRAALGHGDTDIPRILSKLRIAGYAGPLLLEIDTSQQGHAAIQSAADYIRSML